MSLLYNVCYIINKIHIVYYLSIFICSIFFMYVIVTQVSGRTAGFPAVGSAADLLPQHTGPHRGGAGLSQSEARPLHQQPPAGQRGEEQRSEHHGSHLQHTRREDGWEGNLAYIYDMCVCIQYIYRSSLDRVNHEALTMSTIVALLSSPTNSNWTPATLCLFNRGWCCAVGSLHSYQCTVPRLCSFGFDHFILFCLSEQKGHSMMFLDQLLMGWRGERECCDSHWLGYTITFKLGWVSPTYC